MKTALLIISVLAVGCASRGPDPSLFPIDASSPEYTDGFRAGFQEGIQYCDAIADNKTTP
jgi:hypothetical protein